MHAEITAYRGRLIIALLVNQSIPGEVTTSQDNPRFPGQMIYDTATHLGVSEEALELMRSLQKGDDIGDVNWLADAHGKPMFFWRGGRYAVFSPDYCYAATRFKIRKHVSIPNRVPVGARAQLDRLPSVHRPTRGLLSGMEL
jgi:hypothetical protein